MPALHKLNVTATNAVIDVKIKNTCIANNSLFLKNWIIVSIIGTE